MALSSGKEKIRNEAMAPSLLTAFLLLWCIPTVPSPVADSQMLLFGAESPTVFIIFKYIYKKTVFIF
jgi:hypothetical protein